MLRSFVSLLTLDRLQKTARYLLSGNLGYVRARFRALAYERLMASTPALDLAQSARLFAPAGVRTRRRAPALPTIDIIVPVYGGFKWLAPLLDAIVRNTDSPHRLILVDDRSPDRRVRPYLRKFARAHPNVVLLLNKTNVGFVRSINLASQQVRGHFVILNTDVQVPRGWLGRLMRPILDDPSVASTTPFTNAGTICSFPVPHVDNALFADLELGIVDEVFRRVNPGARPIELPTGVGFCMGMNHDVWKKIGPFNETEFGRGYGEENDWCMRAMAAGYRNLMTTDLFVYHQHGASFPSEEKRRLMDENLQKLLRLHPSYMELVQSFVKADPPAALRAFAGLLLAASASSGRPTLIVDHAIGGGANTFRRTLVEKRLKAGLAVFLLTYDTAAKTLKLLVRHAEHEFTFRVSNPDDLALLANHVSFGEIVYNNLVSYPDPLAIVRALGALKARSAANLTVYVHDYYMLCPSYTLLNLDGHYCDLPSTDVCRVCLPHNPHRSQEGGETVVDWRRAWAGLLQVADQIVCFSESSRGLIRRVYGAEASRIVVQPHRALTRFARKPRRVMRAPLSIAAVGALNYAKGSQMILDVARELAGLRPEARMTVIGILDRPANAPNVFVTGPYSPADLPRLMEQHKINLCFFPSICPETFSYVITELIALDMPIAGFRLGAPGDRLAAYKRGRLISRIDAAAAARELAAYHDELARNALATRRRLAGPARGKRLAS
jgi:GT2 family glycosyltransferase/glycosyltransferase involved in cell wall biosynthesis